MSGIPAVDAYCAATAGCGGASAGAVDAAVDRRFNMRTSLPPNGKENGMSPLIRLSILLVMTLAPAVSALADPVYPPNPQYANFKLDPIYPYRGTYYDPTQSGTGIQVDVGASGNAFVTYYSYTATGQPDWYILQGTYQPSDEVTRWTTGVIGTLSGTFYQAFNGQCLGCPYTPTGGAALTNYNATLTWTNSREVKMTVGDQHWDFIAPNLDGKDDGDYLVGTWVIHVMQWYDNRFSIDYSLPAGKFLYDRYATFTIKPDPQGNNITISPKAAPGLTAFNPGVKVYVPACAEAHHAANEPPPLCGPAFLYSTLSTADPSLQNATFEFWYDPATRRFGADVVSTARQIGPINQHIDLYIEDPDLIIGRGITEGSSAFGTRNYENLFIDGQMNIELILQRMPDGYLGSNYTSGL
jgi:hypothetical protein